MGQFRAGADQGGGIDRGRAHRAFVAERYGSFDSPLGRKIRAGEATLAELSDLAVKNGAAAQPGSGRQEWLEAIVNTVLFRG